MGFTRPTLQVAHPKLISKTMPLACHLPQKKIQNHGSSISGPPPKSSKILRCNSDKDIKTPMSAGYLHKKSFFTHFPANRNRFKLTRSESERKLPPVKTENNMTGKINNSVKFYLDTFPPQLNKVIFNLNLRRQKGS